MKLKTIEDVKNLFKEKDYLFFEKGDYNLNIFAIRDNDTKSNTFNDKFYAVFKASGEWKILSWSCTVDPGTYYRENPSNVDGTGILVPGQYRKSHQIGLHQGKYEALVQRGPVSVYRDANKDDNLDMDEATIQSGLFGVNIHHAGENSTQVDKWSAACTVFAKLADFEQFMSLARQGAQGYGNSFTYTLFKDA